VSDERAAEIFWAAYVAAKARGADESDAKASAQDAVAEAIVDEIVSCGARLD
jgi:hypothetical protein